MTIPANLGKTPCNREVEIFDAKIPLLLSKSSLKKANTSIDLQNDKVTMFEEDIDIKLSSNGHYATDILPTDIYSFNDVNEVLIFENYRSEFEKIKVLTKAHKQFRHASIENMRRLLNNASPLNSETSKLIEKVYNSCKICLIYKKPSHRPVVGLSKASNFNDTVAMDLYQLGENLWYFHFIDEFSRFSCAIIVKTKSSKIIIEKFLQNWISVFGSPSKIFSDNGGEFVSQDFIDLCENFNINIIITLAESPWSNGACERQNKFSLMLF